MSDSNKHMLCISNEGGSLKLKECYEIHAA